MQIREVTNKQKHNKPKTVTLRFAYDEFKELELIKDDNKETWEGIVSKAMKNYEATKPT